MDECKIEFKDDRELLDFLEVSNTYMASLEDTVFQLGEILIALERATPTLNHKAKIEVETLRKHIDDAGRNLQAAVIGLREFSDKLGFETDYSWY